MIGGLIHFGLACVVAYSIFYVVQHKDKNLEENDLFNGTIEVPLVTISESSIDISFVIPEEDLIDTVIDDRFVIGNLITTGHVGMIREGMEMNTENSKVVIKLSEPGVMADSLENEYNTYVLLGAEDPDIMKLGIPSVLYYGVFGGYKVMVQKMLGPTLRELMEFTGKNKLSGTTIMKIGMQAMEIFNYIHSKSVIVYDISSSNMAIGSTKETLNKIFFFDFASSIQISAEDSEYMPRNDLILFSLVLLELNGVEFSPINEETEISYTEDTFEYLLNEWDQNYIQELCAQSENPAIFLELFEYLNSLNPEDHVDYRALKDIFADGLTYDEFEKKSLGIFD